MRARHHLCLVLAFAALSTVAAGAQNLPWPTDQPRPGGAAPWPSGGPSAAPAPMMPMAAPPQAMSPQASPFGGGGGGDGGGPPPCLAEFVKLRQDVEKKGAAAKTAGEHKATREEMCKHVTVYAAAEAKWVKFTETNLTACGIPPQVAQQLKQVHSRTEQTREKICAAGPAAGPGAPPSLADALGTTRLPTPDTAKTGGGTFDTLTGNAIQR